MSTQFYMETFLYFLVRYIYNIYIYNIYIYISYFSKTATPYSMLLSELFGIHLHLKKIIYKTKKKKKKKKKKSSHLRIWII